MQRRVIIGSGNLADALSVALTKKGEPPIQIFSRNTAEGKALAAKCGCSWTSDPAKLEQADIYFLAVSDKAIATVSASLDFGNAVVAHTSGSTPIDSLSAKIANRGVFYPMQTFTKGREADFSVIPIMIEGTTPKSIDTLTEAAQLLSDNIMQVDSGRRAMIHMAAVFAGNFTNYMYTVGEEIAREAGMDFSVLKPLIIETAAKAASAESPRSTQTGPASRNDFQTKAMHCEMLREKPALKNIYINLSNNIWEISKKTSQK